jgi:hypothetical protein
MSIRVVWLQAKRLIQMQFRLRNQALREQGAAKVIVSIWVRGAELNDTPKTIDCSREVPQLKAGCAKIEPDGGVIGCEPRRVAQAWGCLSVTADALEHVTQLVVGFGESRLQLRGDAEVLDRFVGPAQRTQGPAAAQAIAWLLRLMADRFGEQLNRPRMIAFLLCGQTEQIEGFGVMGLILEDSSICCRCLGESTGAVLFEAVLK